MTERLKGIWKGSRYWYVRVAAAAVLVFLILFVAVSAASDLGLSTEIADYRVWVWIMLPILSLVIGLLIEVRRSSQQNTIRTNELEKLRLRLRDLESSEASLLRLMETYKRNAYTDILDYLSRLADLLAMQEKWREAGAKLEMIQVRSYSDAEELDPQFAILDRLAATINIGEKDKVATGMEFAVLDSITHASYGVVVVQEVHRNGSTCSLISVSNDSYWAESYRLSESGEPGMFKAHDNIIAPNLPPDLEGVAPDVAEDLRTLILRLASDEQT